MEMRKLAGLLEQDGWKKIQLGVDHMGARFDIVGQRRYGPTRWDVLVRIVKHLDAISYGELVGVFSQINERSRSWFLGRCFLFCVIAEGAAPNVVRIMVGSSEAELLAPARLKGGGGNILVADLSTKQVYAQVPSFPLDVAKYTRNMIKVLQSAM